MTLSFRHVALYGLTLAFPLAILFHYQRSIVDPKPDSEPEPTPPVEKRENNTITMMQPERADLAPPKDDPFTQEELKAYDGNDSTKPVYVAIKGTSLAQHPSPLLLSSLAPSHTPCHDITYRNGVRRDAEARNVRTWWILRDLRGQGRIARPRAVEPQARRRSAGLEHTRGEGPQDPRRLACILYVRRPLFRFFPQLDDLHCRSPSITGNGITLSAASLTCQMQSRTSDG
jgi:hypothetical protein